MAFFLFLWPHCKAPQLPLRHLGRMKGHSDMTLGLDVTCHPRQRLSFSSWQEYRLSLGHLIKKMLFFQQPLPELVIFFSFLL